MSKAVTSLAESAARSQLTQRQKTSITPPVETVFQLATPSPLPAHLNAHAEKIAANQINQLKASPPSGAEIIIIASSRSTLQIYRKNPDDTIGHLIMETALPDDPDD